MNTHRLAELLGLHLRQPDQPGEHQAPAAPDPWRSLGEVLSAVISEITERYIARECRR